MWEKERFFKTSDQITIHYRDSGGSGVPVLFIHGFTASIGGQWGKPGLITGMREKGWRTIAFDLRGHGKSERPHGYPAYAGNRMGLDAIELLDHLGIEKAHIVAYSLGAHIMPGTLLDHQHRALTFTMGGSAGRWNWSDALTDSVNREADELENGAITLHILRLMPKGAPRPSEEELRQQSDRKLEGMDPVALAGIKRAMPDHAISRDQMASLTMPILGFVGSEDPQRPDFLELIKFHPGIEFVEIEGAAHGNCPGRPETLSALDGFLRKHSKGEA